MLRLAAELPSEAPMTEPHVLNGEASNTCYLLVRMPLNNEVEDQSLGWGQIPYHLESPW
jgi:hypothetical protein